MSADWHDYQETGLRGGIDSFEKLLIAQVMTDHHSQGGHRHGKPGKLREFEKFAKISGKTQGNLNFYGKNLENSGKM